MLTNYQPFTTVTYSFRSHLQYSETTFAVTLVYAILGQVLLPLSDLKEQRVLLALFPKHNHFFSRVIACGLEQSFSLSTRASLRNESGRINIFVTRSPSGISWYWLISEVL